MFSTTSCMCNLSSLKIHLFFLNERWYKLWLNIAITCFSNTRFTCKMISTLYIWHIKAGKVVLLRPKLETVLAPVSYRSSRRRRQRKRLLLKVPVAWNITTQLQWTSQNTQLINEQGKREKSLKEPKIISFCFMKLLYFVFLVAGRVLWEQNICLWKSHLIRKASEFTLNRKRNRNGLLSAE